MNHVLPSGRGVRRKISRRVKPLASWVATCALLFSPCVPLHAGLLKGDVDFSNYDAPLFQQIVNRIKARVAARLGKGVNTQNRYFIVPFAYQNNRNNPEFSHSFISVIRALADGKQPEFARRMYRGVLGLRGPGQPAESLHQAMSAARQEIARLGLGGLQTWGAYQHYGDPFFRFLSEVEEKSDSPARAASVSSEHSGNGHVRKRQPVVVPTKSTRPIAGGARADLLRPIGRSSPRERDGKCVEG